MLVLLGVLVVLFAAAGWMWFRLTSVHPFAEKHSLNLPYSLGGEIVLAIEGTAWLDLDDKSLNSKGIISTSLEDLNITFPSVVYSVLDSDVDSEHVSSMLGRVSLVAGTAAAREEHGTLLFNARLSGEFFVRERRENAQDEEQPAAGSQVQISGEIKLKIGDPSISAQWRPSYSELAGKIELDAESVRHLTGRFGPGDSFARLVEKLLNSRLSASLERLLSEDRDLRALAAKEYADFVIRKAHKFWSPLLYRLAFGPFELDRCPVLDVEGLSIGYAAKIRLSEPRRGELELPDLKLREKGC